MTVQVISSDLGGIALPYASILGYNKDGSYLGLGTTTNVSGSANIPYGEWYTSGVRTLRASMAGFISENLPLENSDTVFDLENNGTGEEVVVTARKISKTAMFIVIFILVIIIITGLVTYLK